MSLPIWSSKNNTSLLKKNFQLPNLSQNQQQAIKINYLQVFMGVFVFFHDYRVKMIDTPIKLFDHNLRLDYCYSGQVNYDTTYNQHTFFEPGFLKIDSRNIQDQKMSFPRHHYRGISVNLDLDHFDPRLNDLANGQIDLKVISQNYCQDRPFNVIKTPFISHLFSDLLIPELGTQRSFLQLQIAELLLYLCDQSIAKQNLQRRSDYLSASRRDKIGQIHGYLNQHYDQPLKLPTLAQHFGLSLTVMKRDYHYFYARSIHADLKQIRLQAAQSLLAQTRYPVSQIAARVGYQSTGKFSQAFKKALNLTPTEFRQHYPAK